MARYKVIQDIEAEDKLLGPLTLRQFIYAFIAGCLIFLCYFVASHGAAFMIVLFLPFIAVASFFAFPWSHEQSTEIWALARIRFLVMPRKRIWDQSGLKQLVTVNVPKRAAEIFTDGLSQNEVKSRLKTLANTIDSRGWVIKSTNPYVLPSTRSSSDRLLDAVALPQEVPDAPIDNVSDILEPGNNVADKFDTALQQREQSRRQQLIDFIDQPETEPPKQIQQDIQPVQQLSASPADSWFMNLPQEYKDSIAPPKNIPGSSNSNLMQNQLVPQTPAAINEPILDEAAITEELRHNQPKPTFEYSHLPTILPLSESEKIAKQQATQKTTEDPNKVVKAPTSKMTEKPDAAILGYVDRDDLTIGVIEHQVNKTTELGDDEVVISLH